MTRKQPKPGKPDPSRFAAGAEDFEPMRLVETIDGLTEEQRRDNAVHDEAVRQAIEAGER